jgi:DNA-binding response OmpR family regulator
MLIAILSTKRPVNDARRIALIVEDDPRLQKAISKKLGRMDFSVLSAGHYDAAVRHLAASEPHVACVHVQLPARSGYELCEYIRRSQGRLGLPVLVTSKYASPSDLANAEDAGGNAFLRRPFSMRQLALSVA